MIPATASPGPRPVAPSRRHWRAVARACTGLTLAGCCLAGCSVHTPIEHAESPVELPAEFAGQPEPNTDDGTELRDRWWTTLEDPRLSGLIERMLTDNFDLRGAWARLEQADALLVQSGAAYWPQIEAGVNGSRTRFVAPVLGAATNDVFSTSVAASYELDVWGRLSSLQKAAALDRAAMLDDLQSLAMTLTAQVADRYFDEAAAEARLALLRRQLDTNTMYLDLVLLRFRQGQVSALDVYQQRQLVASTRAEVALVEAARDVAANQLSVLLGKPPSARERSDNLREELPLPPEVPTVGVPAQLLLRRPDLKAARRRIESADRRVAAAVADRFPALRLNGRASLEANQFAAAVLSPLWTLAAGLTAPLFDGGRLRAEVTRQKAAVVEQIQAFGQTVLTALLEVENALVQENRQRENLQHLEAQTQDAVDAVREARHRYQQGLSDFLPVLTALRTQQQLERALIDARRQLLAQRIQLCRALGGTWTEELRDPSQRG